MKRTSIDVSVAQLQSRDSQAWELFYDGIASDLRSFVWRIGARDPDDIVGETMLHLVRDIHSFSGTVEQLRSWAFQIARHRVVDASRKTKRRPSEVPLHENESPTSCEAGNFDSFNLADLRHVLDGLSPEQREVLWLRYAMDFSLATTAEIVGSSPDAVASMAYRALSRLRQLL